MDTSLAGLADEDGETAAVTETGADDLDAKAADVGAEKSGKRGRSSGQSEDNEVPAAKRPVKPKAGGRGGGRGKGATRCANATEPEAEAGREATKEEEEEDDEEEEESMANEVVTGADDTKKQDTSREAEDEGADDTKKQDMAKKVEDESKSAGSDATAILKLAIQEDSYFKVLAPLNLGLNLKIGGVYSAGQLRQRCHGNKQKLSSLDKFMKAESKLLPVEAPKNQLVSAAPERSATHALQDEARAEPSGKRPRTKAAEESMVQQPRLLVGQIVWHCGEQRRLAKVVSMTQSEGSDLSYRVAYLADGDDPAAHWPDASARDLKPFSVKDLPRHVMNGSAQCTTCTDSALTSPVVLVPADRGRESFSLGQIVWYLGANRPSWPARVEMLPTGESDSRFRIQLLNPRGCSQDGEVLSASNDELLAFDKDDMPAYAQVAKVAQDAFMKHQGNTMACT